MMTRNNIKVMIEALVFAASSDEHLDLLNLQKLISTDELQISFDEIEELIGEINADLEKTERPYRIVSFANKYQFATLPEFGMVVERMLHQKTKKRFTNAQLETLSIIAYKQPVSKPEVDKIRGVVSSGDIINTLIEKGFVEIVGRKEIIGRPLLYGTTDIFLQSFGLQSLTDLPRLPEIEEIVNSRISDVETGVDDLVIEVKEEDVSGGILDVANEFIVGGDFVESGE